MGEIREMGANDVKGGDVASDDGLKYRGCYCWAGWKDCGVDGEA